MVKSGMCGKFARRGQQRHVMGAGGNAHGYGCSRELRKPVVESWVGGTGRGRFRPGRQLKVGLSEFAEWLLESGHRVMRNNRFNHTALFAPISI